MVRVVGNRGVRIAVIALAMVGIAHLIAQALVHRRRVRARAVYGSM